MVVVPMDLGRTSWQLKRGRGFLHFLVDRKHNRAVTGRSQDKT
jgi:hypothetical protein